MSAANDLTLPARMRGALWGALAGDALGVPVEFLPRAARVADPVVGMRAYGTHRQPAGTWSDDGALLLCTVESLAEKGFDIVDMGRRFVAWVTHGHWTAHGDVFDIGGATSLALQRIQQGVPAEAAGGTDEGSNGNGSLMRILPVALFSHEEETATLGDRISRASAITHGHERSRLACVFYALVVRQLLRGADAGAAHRTACAEFTTRHGGSPEFGHFAEVLQPGLADVPEISIRSGGYVMETLEAALWCLLTTHSFAECVLHAVNLGSDTDTTGCVAGGLAGALYGEAALPAEWRAALPRQDELAALFAAFLSRTIQQPLAKNAL